MPLASIIKICGFSSEDPENPAFNLLDDSFEKKWKTLANGEKLAYVILQLEKPELITGIDVANEHSAFIEIFVARSDEKPTQFIQLVSTSLFMTPFESKKSIYVDRIRSFGKEKILQSNFKKWDLIKIICTQPFNKHIQYGLSFVKIRVKPSANRFVARNVVAKELVTSISTIGSAIHKERIDSLQVEKQPLDKPLKENEAIKLKESKILGTPIIPQVAIKSNDIEPIGNKNANDLLKSQTNFAVQKDSTQLVVPNASIGNIDKAFRAIEKAEQITNRILSEISNSSKNICSKETKLVSKKSENFKISAVQQHKINPNHLPNQNIIRHKPFNTLLQDVVFLISGLQNPDLSEVRSKAEEMGAKYKVDWQKDCTHLVAVFKGTPKYKLVKRNSGKIVKRDWIEACYTSRKRLPWRRFALDPEELAEIESEHEICEMTPDSIESISTSKLSENENMSFNYDLNLYPKKSNLQTGIKVSQIKNKITKFLLPGERDSSSHNINKKLSEADEGEVKHFTNKPTGTVSQQRSIFETEIKQKMQTKLKLQKSAVQIIDFNK